MNYSVNDYNAKVKKGGEPNAVTLPFVLINDVSKILLELMDGDGSNGKKLPKSYKLILTYLIETSDVTQLDIANATHLQAPTVSLKLKNMEDDGLVSRVADEFDRRVIRVNITDAGRSLYATAIKDNLGDTKGLLEGITKEEVEIMNSVLNRIIDNARKLKADDRKGG